MTSTDVRTASSTAESPMPGTVDMKLEVVVLPVSDVGSGQALLPESGLAPGCRFPHQRRFSGAAVYADRVAGLDHLRHRRQRCHPGSAERLLLVVQDIEAARADLVARGVDVSEVFHGAGFRAGRAGRIPGPDPKRRSYSSFASFSDPDGNGWMLQEITQRLPGR